MASQTSERNIASLRARLRRHKDGIRKVENRSREGHIVVLPRLMTGL